MNWGGTGQVGIALFVFMERIRLRFMRQANFDIFFGKTVEKPIKNILLANLLSFSL
jgi:hypothetical protein